MKIKELYETTFDRAAAKKVYDKIQQSPKSDVDLTEEEREIFKQVMDAAKQKLTSMLNANSDIKTQWPTVIQFIRKFESIVPMFTWDMWFKTNQFLHDPTATTVKITGPANHQRLVVGTDMYNFLKWRFIIQWVAGKVERNNFTKRDIEVIDKIRVFLK